jgi:uncharacterized protein
MGRLLTFLAIALGLLGAIHYYLWVRLVRDPQLPAPWGTVATSLLVLLAASIPAVLILGRRHQLFRDLFAWPAYLWLGLMFLFLVVLAAGDGVRVVAVVVRRMSAVQPLDTERRTFVARMLAGAAALVAGGLGVAAFRAARCPIGVRRLRVRLDRLPAEQHGLRIVQLTDVHVGPTIGRGFVEDIVAETNALEPDVVVITGDLIDGRVDELAKAVAPLANLRARHGTFFVTGNHEYYYDVESWLAELPKLGIRVLRNERVSIGTADASFDLAGVDDRSAADFGGLTTSEALAAALGGRDDRRELVLLAHQPRMYIAAEPYAAGLQLSGHTHGGQLWPFVYLVKLQQPIVAGLHRRGRTQIYVSRGTGYWGPPMRLGAPAEITEITLESGRAA